jgi:hypothetical protein
MQHPEQLENRDLPQRNIWSRPNIVLIAFLAIAGFYLITEHQAHVFGYLPFLLLLACPFLHMFMHRGHGGHGGSGSMRPPDRKDENPPSPPVGGGHQH